MDAAMRDKNRILLESSTPNGVPALPAVPTPTGTLLERSAPDGGEVPSEVPTIESTEVMETSAKNAKESAVEGLDDARVGSEASTQKDVVDLWEDDQSDYEEALAAPPASTAPQGTAVEEAVSESSSGKTLLSQSLSNPSDIGTDTRARLSTGSSSSKPMRLSSSSSASYKRPAISDNLDAADIKTLQWKVKSDPGGSGALADPVDELFAGMAPEIAKVSTVRVDDSSSKTSSSASKFSMVDVLNDDQGDTGWDELEW
ncbi:unnamed protein product [Cyprideis torosa]|uniref:Uncharacterized protein n=1 Tax=Cyprideis torosa TaxID=163714 RepID=A0A7R8W8Z3_9CRUS|nr:unnamed protein product [Cyprideis torosa]CAG0884334.1 unnamed protein product [Cyprideis torosa]